MGTYLELVGYYRPFISRFATKAAPLTELTRKCHPNQVRWTKEAEQSFTDLKQALSCELILQAPNFNEPFVLQTDASELGVGAMLSQILKGMEHPVMFISRKLLPHEKNYATVEKECLAIKWAVEKLRYYLLGRKFILVTDNAPLKWKSQNKGKNARINQWFLRLQDFQFTVEHRAGNSHVNADAMSRRLDCCGMYAPSRSLELGRGGMGRPRRSIVPHNATWAPSAPRRAPSEEVTRAEPPSKRVLDQG